MSVDHKKGLLNDEPEAMGQKEGSIVEEQLNDPAYQAREKWMVRKLDITLMPIIFILYMFNYLDRNNIA